MWLQISKKTCVQNDYIWNPSTCTCEGGKYLESIIDDSVIMCDEIIDAVPSEPTKTMPINFNDKKITSTMDKFYILFTFY